MHIFLIIKDNRWCFSLSAGEARTKGNSQIMKTIIKLGKENQITCSNQSVTGGKYFQGVPFGKSRAFKMTENAVSATFSSNLECKCLPIT